MIKILLKLFNVVVFVYYLLISKLRGFSMNYTLLMVVYCLSSVSFQNIAAFDKEVLGRATEFLKQKERSRKLRALLYPGVYPEKKSINEQQYLQRKQEKLLTKYEESRATAQDHGTKQAVIGTAGALGVIFCISNHEALGTLISLIIGGAGGYAAYENFSYMCNNPSAVTEQEKKAALLIILNKKINEVKSKINDDKQLLDHQKRFTDK